MLPSSSAASGDRPLVLLAVAPHLAEQIFSPSALEAITGAAEVLAVTDPAGLGDVPDDVLARAEVVVTGWGTQQVDTGLARRMPLLRAVVHTGGSVRKVVSREVLQQGMLVSTQASTNAEPVAEYTHAMVTLSLKGIFRSAQDYQRERAPIDVYTRYRVAASHQPTVGVVGASRIGRLVIGRLRASGVRILLHDPYCHDAEDLGATLVDLPALFAGSDVVTLHAPEIEETRGMVSQELLALMPDGSTLVNTARGSVVDGVALEAELVRGRIRAILDVTEPLVPHPESPLWDLPNVLLTPHMAGAVGTELTELGAAAAGEVLRCLSGEAMQNLVSVEQFDRSA